MTIDAFYMHKTFSLIITPDSKYIISTSMEANIKIVDIKTYKIVHSFPPPTESSRKLWNRWIVNIIEGAGSLAVSSDLKFLAAAYQNGIRVFDMGTKQEIYYLKDDQAGNNMKLEFSIFII